MVLQRELQCAVERRELCQALRSHRRQQNVCGRSLTFRVLWVYFGAHCPTNSPHLSFICWALVRLLPLFPSLHPRLTGCDWLFALQILHKINLFAAFLKVGLT